MTIDQIRLDIPAHLSEYCARDENYVEWKLRAGWKENHEAWIARKAITEHARADFYRRNDTYLWELGNWNMEPGRWACTQKLVDFVQGKGVGTVVDIGGGIGTDDLALASVLPGAEFLMVEPNMLCREFYKWRWDRYGFGERMQICDPDEYGFGSKVDLTICLDVLEHLEDPLPTLGKILDSSRYVVVNFAGNFKPQDFPMHLPKNQARRDEYGRIMQKLDKTFNPDATYMGRGRAK